MVEHGATNAEGVSKMHRRHCGKRIDVIPFHPHTLGIIMSDAVEESVFSWKETWRHARVADEYYKGKEIR